MAADSEMTMEDALPDNQDGTISLRELIEDAEEQELEADLVLGGDEGEECTYSKGYMKRQAVFSCLTCTPEGNAGVCTACSLTCHDGHKIVELWTKRNFRCDCGNSKFGVFFCKLSPNKEVENAENSYNHNFKGVYCTCGRPYPDPDAEEEEAMIQCCICEDWFHAHHLGLESSDLVSLYEDGDHPTYEDVICQACSIKCSFLMLYPNHIWAATRKSEISATNAKDKGIVEEVQVDCGSIGKLGGDNNVPDPSESGDASAIPEAVGCSIGDGETSAKTSDEKLGLNNNNPDARSSNCCLLGVDLVANPPFLERSRAMLLARNWRDALCQCKSCLNFYTQKQIEFLVDKDDTITEYEKKGKKKREETLQQQQGMEMDLLNSLGHVRTIEVLSGIEDMKNEITSYLGSIDPARPVTTADIHQAFENLAKKRRRDS